MTYMYLLTSEELINPDVAEYAIREESGHKVCIIRITPQSIAAASEMIGRD